MIKDRLHRWNCSKFADWIRGEKKPYALEWGAWYKYGHTFKDADDALDKIREEFYRLIDENQVNIDL